jgi:hypothetical protein
MLMTAVLVLFGVVWLFRLYRSEQDRTWLLIAVAVGVGLLLVNKLPAASVGGAPVIELARQAGYVLGPFVLLAGVVWGLWRLARSVWARWPERRTTGRALGVLGSVAVGLVAAELLRSVPVVAEVTQVAEHATTVGVRAGWHAAVERLGVVLGVGHDGT